METKILGPWAGGLNLTANRGLSVFLNDNELGEALNVMITDEGFIAPRPGLKVLRDSRATGLYERVKTGGLLSIVGNINSKGNAIDAIIQVKHDVTNATYLYRVQGEGSLITPLMTINGNAVATSVLAHSGFVSAITGTYAYPADTGILIFTNDPTQACYLLPLDLDQIGTQPPVLINSQYKIPPSTSSMIVKDRLFLFDHAKSIMWWSPPGYILDFRTDAATVAAAPFGKDTSGQEILEASDPTDIITGVEYHNNSFYIFKPEKTFVFTYQLSPLTDGYLRKMNEQMGAWDSCQFKDNIIVINQSGVYRVDNTEFVDLQSKMNFKVEFPISTYNATVFITPYGNNVIFGWDNTQFVTLANSKRLYYCMNAVTGAWSEWSYDYHGVSPNTVLDIPVIRGGYGVGKPVVCNDTLSNSPKLLFVNRSRNKIMYMPTTPDPAVLNYHLDSNIKSDSTYDKLYFPNVSIKTTANVGASPINFKKLYKYFIRFYLSEMPALVADGPVWTISVNYDSYTFDSTKNPIFNLYPAVNPPPYPDPRIATTTVNYFRSYQLKITQQRVREFVFELKRKSTSMDPTTVLTNPDSDRLIKSGYYFMLTRLWCDYQDKARI